MEINDETDIQYMRRQDLALILGWRNDIRVRKYMFDSELIDLNDHVAWFNRVRQDKQKHLLLVSECRRPFGFVQFNVSGCGTVADWGFYIDPDCPKGKGTTLGHTALNFGFNNLSLLRICGRVLSKNSRSMAFHAKLGFTSEGILRSHHFSLNDYDDVYLFGILAKEWTSTQLNTISAGK